VKKVIAFGLVTETLVYFCVGFTTLALLTYADDGVVDMSRSLIVGAALALFQFVRFGWDLWRDIRDQNAANLGSTHG
jgi:hypothetical protein